MLRKITSLLALILSFLAICMCILIKMSAPKIGYIRTAVVLEKYEGMIEAKNEYDKKSKVWEANIDTLKKDLIRNVEIFNNNFSKLSLKEKEKGRFFLKKKEDGVITYKSAVEENADAEKEKMLKSVVGQINSFIEKYGKNNGYKVILGTTADGSILYGDNSIDITEEVLINLNNEYKR